MKFKNIFNKIIKKSNNDNKIKIESNDSYCYSQIIWNSNDNLIILISFSKDYFEQIIDIQDAINYTWRGLASKIVYSSYDEKTDKKDEDGNNLWIIHKKYYMLIGGSPSEWKELYMNIHDLGNEVLAKITDEITNNCDSSGFQTLIVDGVFNNFNTNNINYDSLIENNSYIYADPEIIIKRLPNGFTGRDILKFIKINYLPNKFENSNGLDKIKEISNMDNESFKNHDLYPLYLVLFKNPTVEKLGMLLEPLYKQPDDDSIPGDISDESLDAIFRERYERFSAIADNNIYYEDIDEQLSNDEESENIRKENII